MSLDDAAVLDRLRDPVEHGRLRVPLARAFALHDAAAALVNFTLHTHGKIGVSAV